MKLSIAKIAQRARQAKSYIAEKIAGAYFLPQATKSRNPKHQQTEARLFVACGKNA